MQYHSLKQPSKQVVFLSLSLFVCLPLSISICNFAEDGAATKGMFVFGSSLVDNGNNNFFESRAKADYLPYGIDFPNGPSGRFTNGKNVVDLLGDQLKLPSFIPPSKDPSTKGSKIVHGVNHASGSSGILDDTGSVAGNVINLSQQIRDFEEETLPELEAELGCKSSESLPSYLFVVGVGGNDYMFNYFARNSHSLSGEGKSDDRDDDDGGDQNMNGKSDGEKEGRLFKSFSLEDYAWRVYHERLFLKDPLDRYRFN
ncbi:hypothetical protein CerSpe_273320 [Prunus speciosa]